MSVRARSLAAIFAGSIAAEIGGYAMPFIVGGIVRGYAIAEGMVGVIIALQVGTSAVIAIGLASRMHRIDRRMLACVGMLLIILGYFGTALGQDAVALTFSRLCGGAGEGMMLAAVTATAADTDDPDRSFALVWIAVVVMAMALFLSMPTILAHVGERGVFVVLAIVVLCLSPLLACIPRGGMVGVQGDGDSAATVWTIRGAALCVAVALLAISANGFWYFLEGIGSAIHMSAGETGRALSIAAIVALAGPVAAHVIGARFGRFWPILGGLALNGSLAFLVTRTTSPPVFTGALALSSAAYVFTLPYLLASASAIGGARLATAARGAQAVGGTLTPAISGLILLAGAGYGVIGWVALGCALIAILMAIAASRAGPVAPVVVAA